MNKRAKNNTNLRITHAPEYNGREILQLPEGIVINYLESMDNVYEKAFNAFSRILVVRIDLSYPRFHEYVLQEGDMTDFLKALNYRLATEQLRRMKAYGRGHSCDLRFFWAMEQKTSLLPHYHVVLVLNHAFYGRLGQFDNNPKSLAYLIKESWASVLDMDVNESKGLVNFTTDGVYSLKRSDGMDSPDFRRMYKHLSYLAKLSTKLYGNGKKWFSASRK